MLGPEMDMRFSALFMIVFIRVNTRLLTPFFSLGAEGPPCAGELIVGNLEVVVIRKSFLGVLPADSDSVLNLDSDSDSTGRRVQKSGC